jgi:hypothetical protein
MIFALISITWLTALGALVAVLATRQARTRTELGATGRSPALLESKRMSFEREMGELLLAKPSAFRSKPAAAEHVRDGAQEDLYVRP